MHVNYLAVDELPIRSRGQIVGLSSFPNDLGFITASSLVQADLGVTDTTSRAFVRGQRPLSAVAYSGLASDLIGSVQSSVLQADWLQADSTLASFIRNRPQLAAVATQGRYDSLLPATGQPTPVLAADASITGVQGTSIPVVNLPVPPRQIAADWLSTDQNSIATIQHKPTLAAVATSGGWGDILQKPTVYDSVDYSLLQNAGTTLAIRNLPSIPAAQVNSDWGANTGVAAILNRPTTAQLQSQILVQANWAETNPSSYAYISGKPAIPAAQVQTDWGATSGIASIANKPALGKVATSNLYGDLQGLPTIPAAQVSTDWQLTDGSKPNALINRPTWSTLAYSGRYSDILPNTGQPAIPNTVDWNATSSTTTTLSIINRPQFTTPVQANYQETDSSQLSYIRGKPTLATVAATGSYTDLVNVPPNAAAQQQADYGQTDSTSVTYIKGKPSLAAVATSGRYDALLSNSGQPMAYLYADWNATSSGNGALVIYNKPVIPAAQVQADLGQTDTTQPSYVKNVPAFAKVATSGSYTDLSNTPTIAPQIQADLAQTDSTKLDYIKNKIALAAVATSGRYDSLLAGSGQPTVPTSVSWLATASTATVLYIPDKPTKLSAFTNDSGFYSSGSDISCGLLSSSGAARLNAGVTTTTITFSGGVTGFSGAYSQLSGLPTSLSQFVNNLTGSAGNWTVNNSGTLFTDNLGPATQGGGVFLQMGLTVPFELFGAIQSETQADGSTASVDAGYIALNYFDTGRDSTKPGVALRLVDLSSRPRLGVRARAAGSSTATTDGDLDVGTLTASRNLAVAGTSTFAGTLTAGALTAGAVTASSLAASGAISSGGTISGAVSATSLAASGATTLNSTLSVSGATTAAAVSCTTLAASGSVSGPIAATTLSASGAATLNSTLAVTGATTAAGISCSGLSCAGTVSGAVQATTLNASGAASLGAALSVATSLTVAGNTVYLGNNRAGLYRTGGANPITVLQANDVITPDTTLAGGAFLVDSANTQFSWQSRPANSSTDTTVATLSFTTGNFSTTGTLAASGGVAGPVAATTLSASGATTAAAVSCTSLTASGTVSGAVQASTLSASGAATLSSTLSVAGATTAAALTTSGLATLSRVQVGDTSDSTLGLSIMSSTMAAGSLRGLCVGQAASNFNRAELFFFYQGSGLATNRARFGLYGVDGVSVWGNGFVGVNAGTTQPTAQLSVTGTLAASGSAALTGIVNAGTISSTGAVSAPILASTLSASGATTLNSTLSVSGSTSAAAVSCSSLSSSGNISGPVAATVLSASGAATLSGSLGVSGATTTAGISCTTLTSTGTIAGPVAATTLSASGAATLSGTLAVSGATTAAAISCTTLSASGATTLSSALVVSGTTTAAAISCTALNSSGNVSAPIAATTLSASGAATLSNTLAVSGATTLNGTLAGTGATFSGTLATNQLVATTPGGSSSVGRAVQTNLDVGDLVSWRGTQAGDAYGFGQYTGGATRLFASSYYSPATVSLSFATNTTANYSGGFTDVLRVTQGSPNAVTIAGSLSASGSTSLGGSLAVAGATSLTGNVSLISGSSPALAVINSAGNGASAYINMGGYNTFSNGSPLTLQCLDSNYSADLVVLTKTAGAAGNAQAERFRIGNSGAVSMAGQISSGYHYITGADANSRSILSLAAPNPINTIAWGQALATNQSAFLNYVGATSSKIQMGIYGSNPVTVDAGGNMAVPALLTTSNRFSVHLYPIATFSLPANTASVYPAASWSNYSSQGAQPQYTNNSTPYTSNTNGMLDSNGYWLCPASGVWAVSFGVVYSSSGTTTTNACWLIVTSGTTDVSQNGLLGNVNQRLGLQQNSGLFGTAAVTQCFAAGDRVAPVMMSNTAQTVGGNTQGLLNISLVTLLT